MNKHKQPGPTSLLPDIGQIIKAQTGIWYGGMDIANALARGLRGLRLTGDQPVSMMLILGRTELRASPNRLPAVAMALNACGDTDQVTEAIVSVALMEVMRLAMAGVIVVTVSCEGELSLEAAQSLGKLIQRRVGAGLAQRQAERLAA